MRASYSERLSTRQRQVESGRGVMGPPGEHYKSNSSLDLDHELDILQESNVGHHVVSNRNREYGSHGSLDMMGAFNKTDRDGPVAVSTLTRTGGHFTLSNLNRSEDSATGSVISTGSQDHTELDGAPGSPKTKKKAIASFWNNNKEKNPRKSQKSLFKKRTKDGVSENGVNGKGGADIANCDTLDNKAEDKHRRRFFSHFDTASVCASLSVSAQLRTLQRRNTTTGASAASAALRGGQNGDSLDSDIEADHGDGVNNELVLRYVEITS